MRFIDISGNKYGKLTVNKCYTLDGKSLCDCVCDCGNYITVYKTNLSRGKVKSCGCYRIETTMKRSKRYNYYDFEQDFAVGYDCNGKPFYFDKEDYEKIKNISWRIHKDGGVVGYNRENKKYVKMHRMIMSCDDVDVVIDHINHNRNDNRKINLRLSTRSENSRNVVVKRNNTSGCPGVCWNKNKKKWIVRITVDKYVKNLGYYDNISDAIKVRKEAEEKYFGNRSYDNSVKSIKGIAFNA